MYYLTKHQKKAIGTLLKWVIEKPSHWYLVVITNRNSTNVGGIEKDHMKKNDLITMLEVITSLESYSEWEKIRLNRLRTLYNLNNEYPNGK